MKNDSILQVDIQKFREGNREESSDQLAIEEPLEIQLKYGRALAVVQRSIAVTMRTPGMDIALATGFLFTEGIIQNIAQLASVEAVPFDANRVVVTLRADILPELGKLERNFYTTSSCGVCGKASIDSIKTVSAFPASEDVLRVSSDTLIALPGILKDQQSIFERTGGLHAAAFFSASGKFIALCEDVGRHNALDKLIGTALMEGMIPFNDGVLLLSGRASFELLQKAMMAGIKIVAAIGAPSSLAVALAKEARITLVGFLRNGNFNMYTEPQRIVK